MINIDFTQEWKDKLLARFLTYVKIYSTSDPESETTPSTPQQWDMANLLFNELKELGLEDVSIDEHGYVFGFIPSNLDDKEVPQIGFIAHYDSTPDFNGKGVNPQIWKNYDGGDLVLNQETGFTLSSSKFESLKDYIGQTLITTDGTTLLSADDKAGIAEIVTAAEYLIAHPEIKHGRISVGFNPDEEIGRGAHKFNVEKFGAEWAYTMDGGEVGELEYENFNAAGAVVKIHGLSVHPGYSYGKMVNAGLLAADFINRLPSNETPSTTRGFEGFYHLLEVNADVSEAKLQYIIRDHDAEKFEARKSFMLEKVKEFNAQYGEGVAEIEIKEQYRNMKQQFEGKMHIIDFAEEAMKIANIEPKIKAIRGGTDGAQLSYMGLPCPNIFAGGLNFHGPYEYVPLESMEKATKVILNIAQLVAEK
ncbi:peptidase T [Riemerella anatipestifer]|uniref:Peptidase T n=1 Tax=Riemerella anatipestifer (strain ATCC 11845 / DSM 15868 / JCM 9532 / NCTC 11014) TaxID=693978 RepID=E4TCM3_RIEAD|nr:peptidase T [Riemerella anatipestifer]ADQ82532.1 peptidase T [Riemerella anatipestifer ATCC 11845 = DSM 15868]AFD56540.1 peptidase t [Riemerella anatipestifer ATCC 11845 = DSM 15868]MDD1524694.1 peptidase T [Riemerella anatipestifer]MRM92979.1 peptidase T [Riemerella anatipestifer]MRN03965.1 peptidase T [Riemerella anatipestifer]